MAAANSRLDSQKERRRGNEEDEKEVLVKDTPKKLP